MSNKSAPTRTAAGGDPLSAAEFEPNQERHGGVISLWRVRAAARSYFGSMEGDLSLDGNVRTTTVFRERLDGVYDRPRHTMPLILDKICGE